MGNYERNMNTIDNKVLEVFSRAISENDASTKAVVTGNAPSGNDGTVDRAILGTRNGDSVHLSVVVDSDYNYKMTIEDRVVTGSALFDQRTNLNGQINYNFINILTLRVSEFLEKMKG